MRIALYLLVILGSAFSTVARGHFSGLVDTSVQIAEPGIRIIYTVPADHLPEIGAPSGERSGLPPPEAYLDRITAGWQVESDGGACVLVTRLATAVPQVDAYQYQLNYRCPVPVDRVRVRYGLLDEPRLSHRNFTRVFLAGRVMRWSFDAGRDLLEVDVHARLAEWGAALEPGFAGEDPNRTFTVDSAGASGDDSSVVTREASPAPWTVDPAFLFLGIEHILLGADHVLFVVALLLVPSSLRRLAWWLTLFTLAHSATLALAFYGLLRLAPAVTEPLIALTLVAVGVENLLILRGGPQLLAWRSTLVFTFGLVHGLGLSYQLQAMATGVFGQDLGRLVLFNAGVEVGQLAIVLGLGAPLRGLLREGQRATLSTSLSSIIAGAGLWWAATRGLQGL